MTIFDLDAKLIAYTGVFPLGVRHVWVESACRPSASSATVCVLDDRGVVTRLEEKPLRAKLDMLFRKSLFLLAASLARSYQQALLASSAAAASSSSSSAAGAETAGAGGSLLANAAAERVRAIDPILADIHRRHAEHLYAKGDFEGAMNQFVKTIGWTQPSYVIRKVSCCTQMTAMSVL